MARELEDYRANLELIKAQYPDKAGLTIKETEQLLRRDCRTLLKDRAFPAQLIGGKYFIPITALARYMS